MEENRNIGSPPIHSVLSSPTLQYSGYTFDYHTETNRGIVVTVLITYR